MGLTPQPFWGTPSSFTRQDWKRATEGKEEEEAKKEEEEDEEKEEEEEEEEEPWVLRQGGTIGSLRIAWRKRTCGPKGPLNPHGFLGVALGFCRGGDVGLTGL